MALLLAAVISGFGCGGGGKTQEPLDAGTDEGNDGSPVGETDASADAGTPDGVTDDGRPDAGRPHGDCVGCTRMAVGAPTWEPASIALYSGRVGQFGEDYLPLLQSVLAPRHQFYNLVGQFGPAVAHPPPYQDEIYELLAARGITPTQTFAATDFTAPNTVIMTATVVPSAGAAVASSFDFASGPVITNLQFPITVDGDLYRNGQLVDPAFDSSTVGYGQFSPPITVSGSNPPVPAQGVSHFFLNFGKSRLAMPQPMPQPMPVVDGDYEYRVTMTDATGAGWKVVAPFKVGAGGGPASTGIVLKPDADGRFDGSNAAGVNGRWWATGDDFGLDGTAGGGSCPMAGFAASDCSVLTTPTAGMAFHPDPNGKGMCTSGVSAKVVPGSDGMLAWSAIWGNIIGFHLAESGSDPYPANVRPYDAGAHGITGFAFDIDAVPPGGHIRVGFQTSGTENNPAYWGGAGSDVSPVFQPGHFEMRWRDVGGPMYLGANAPPFNPAQLVAIQFHVVSSNIAPVPFTFCVNNIMLLTN